MPEEHAAVPVAVVVAQDCHLCADAEQALADLGCEFPIEVTVLDGLGTEGAALVRRARAPMFPLVLVDGEVFSWGRLPRRKLRRLLERRIASGAVR